MTTVTAAELARRARASALVRISAADAAEYLAEWKERGIAHEVRPGEWALSPAGRAMFSGSALGIDLHDGQAGGAA